MEAQVIEYREGNNKNASTIKMPGMTKYSNIVLKRGMTRDLEFFQWMSTAIQGNVERRDLVVTLLDENSDPAVIWKIHNAWPTKLIGPGLDATGNEVAIETLVLAHEGIQLEAS
jgi:phage tail-like protein